MTQTDTPLNGMTGFARAEGDFQSWRWAWEARSVNGKGLDARFRLPPGHDRLEPKLREKAKASFARGSVQATLTLKREGGGEVSLNTDRLNAYLKAGQPYLEASTASLPNWDGLLALPGVLESETAPDADTVKALDAAILAGFDQALAALADARRAEGEGLHAMLSAHIDEIEALRGEAASCQAATPAAIRDRIAARFQELLPDGLPEERLAQEAAALAVKADIREEIDRLDLHVRSARDLLAGGSPAGRKLDFLAQEFNRETNTLCSKSADPALTRIGLAMKAAVDQFREQVQNVE